ncbi:reprolysin-like metallopeptidase [Pseudozobellia thermophila]|uniref:Por secretion system C-terminal sorting domain-containing protein n=1 Tax=Pseudozobellia thermophila TaxID=192903 RepID=A0A1M6CSL1_9FLAO|nr:zinc-dependent metalloprotease family protein [Pseudozobellia thermophila]SHI63976.1 Por secretion system C-terminal sorting domain-containing protein [Pseudozobellia thermophila]
MVTKLRLVFSITIVFFSFYASGQGKYWEKLSVNSSLRRAALKEVRVETGQVFSFQEKLFKQDLKSASTLKAASKTIYFPDENGGPVAYRVRESSVLAPELSKKYPEIKSYSGYAVDNPTEKIRLSISHKDLQAMIVHADGRPNSYVQKVGDDRYVLYSRTSKDDDMDFVCRTEQQVLSGSEHISAKPVDDQVLRKYRVAISATAEYTQFHGGTVADALAAINATLTRVNEVFETDLAVTLELVSDNDKVIYTNASTDPYTGSLGALGSQAQKALDEEIGVLNYDFGHVLHQGENGGNAGFIGGICTNGQKGSAYSSGQVPQGDVFDLDFVAHEMGHQLGANHTWSYELEGTLVQVEPGSGTTIMGYAGITENDNVASHGDDYFHYVSIDQIMTTLKAKGCGEEFSLANHPPIVQSVEDYVIPKSTAFVLTGNATDIDEDDVLTYTWEQIDNGVVTSATFGPTNPSGANFRSRPPSLEPTRYFPQLSRVLDGNLTQVRPTEGSAWETVSDVEREMNFALTVRDNAEGGGQVVSELVNVLVTNDGGPFAVTSQASPVTWRAGDMATIAWEVAGTDVAPINTGFVDILLSTDGGGTFDTVLASGVENDGSHDIIVPGLSTTEARIMVRPVDNIYYAVNASDFSIEVSEVVLNFSDLEFDVCHFSDLTVPFVYETYLGFDDEVVISVEDAPENLSVTVAPDTVQVDGTSVDILFEATENVAEGTYPIRVVATSAGMTREVVLTLNVFDGDFPTVVLTAPENGLTDTSVKTVLQWEDDPAHTSYEVQIATDAGFANIVEVATVKGNTFTPTDLQNQTTYFWRVKPQNICGEGAFGSVFSFTTVQVSCASKGGGALPSTISALGTPKVVSKISFFEDLPVSDVNVNLNIEHSFLADLVVSLTSPQGTTVTLISNSCGDLQNIDATFDDDGNAFECGVDGTNAISGTVRPLGALSSFNGESVFGEWVLEVADNANSDGGALVDFSLDVCVEGEFRPDEDNDGVFDDGDDLCLDTPEGAEVNTSGCQIFRFPIDNFSVSVQSESCRNNDDGAIFIEPLLKLDYNITIVGNGLDISNTFTNTYSIEGLGSGTYALCITSLGDIAYEPYCFEVTVSQPEALGVSSTVLDNGERLSLALSGSDLYFVEFNGQRFQTDQPGVTLNLEAGKNVLRVSTAKSCQGVYEDEVFISRSPVVFPNPFRNLTKVFLAEDEDQVVVGIFASNGRLLQSDTYRPKGREIELDFTGFPEGIYMIKLQGKKVGETLKVIKQ